jgi:hypothetical protein
MLRAQLCASPRFEVWMEPKARCVNCRTDIDVPASYTDGDHIKCGACGMQHRVLRTNGMLRLVVADVAPLREALRTNEQRIERLENELHAARGSFGIGANAFGLGVIYLLIKVAWDDLLLSRALIVNAVVISVVCGLALELANFLFLSKRKLMNQLAEEIEQMSAETKELQRKIREASLRR